MSAVDFASLDDAQLVAQVQAGQLAAFEPIMRRHNQLLFRTARSILGRDEEAEDAVQEAYISAWRALPNWRGESQLATWLVRIVRNECLGRVRRAAPPSESLDALMEEEVQPALAALLTDVAHGPEGQLSQSQLRRLLEAAIDALPEHFRSAFVLREVEGRSVEEVAQMLEVAEPTVRSRAHRARQLLQQHLSEAGELYLTQAHSFDGARCDRIVAATLQRLAAL